MLMKSRKFFCDFLSPYLLYDYVEDKKETVRIDLAENCILLHIGQCVLEMLTIDDILLIANENITIDTHISTALNKVVQKIEIVV